MATIQAQMGRLSQGGYLNPHLTRAHYDFAWVPMPFATLATASVGGATLTTHWPVEANGRAISGQPARAFVDDFYDRVHVSPQALDLGNVVSTQTSTVRVWNAYRSARSLQAIAGIEEGGIELTGQAATPLLFEPLQERTWYVSVGTAGASVLDVTLRWQFDSEAPGLRITGNRIVAWPFVPDWADGVKETLSWLTDILQSESGAEQRRALRLAPRRSFEATFYLEDRERQLADLALYGWSARIWAMPIWPDVQLLATAAPAGALRIACSTQYLDFVAGGLALLRGETPFNYEAAQIAAIDATGLTLQRPLQSTWPRGTRLYPLRNAQLQEQPDRARLTDQADQMEATFLVIEACEWPAIMPTTQYRGYPVLEQRPDENEDLTRKLQRLLLELDNDVALPRRTDTAGRAFPVVQHRWQLEGRAQRAAFRSLLYALYGRQKALWIPTHGADLTLVATVTSTASTLDVANVGYTRFAAAAGGRRDLRIELLDGAVFHRRVIGATEVDQDVERLALDQVLGREVLPRQVARICWMVLSRADQDDFELLHETDSEGLASSAANFIGVRDDEL